MAWINSRDAYSTDFPRFFDGFSQSYSQQSGMRTVMGRGGSSSLVLDSEKGELVKAPTRLGQKTIPEAKALAALKSHSEAERRRRERINAHLATLRKLVPCSEKTDKATLLAEVISNVKELKRNAIEASKGFVIPMDVDEVRVEAKYHEDDGSSSSSGHHPFCIQATLCCDYRPELLTDLRQTLEALHLKTMSAEISTLGCRVKNVLVLMTSSSIEGSTAENAEVRNFLATSVHQALRNVLDRASGASPELISPPGITTLPNKRRRLSHIDSLTSCS
ncbi:putative transcription factor bHLH107 [Macadamia integrifolia]|uniref:putative transcription factor bHLH107 n=1 Tax=Macadamia integrifolia TaxID=60698 RepID=UPI001C529B5A|nr:putative transcription factor bHLH107 [Macadamia integrifolia]